MVPMKLEGQVVGVLSVMSNEKAVFSERHLRFLEPLASSAAAAISLSRSHHEAMLELDRRGAAEQQRALMQAMLDACEDGIMIWGFVRKINQFQCVVYNLAAPRHLLGKAGEFSTLKDCSRQLNMDLETLAREVNRNGADVKVLAVREGSPGQQLLEVTITPLDLEHVGFLITPK
jgi:signal transduction protein with GAF and PtsI domain